MRNIILLQILLLLPYACQNPQSTDCIQITKEMESLPGAKASELIDSLSYIRLETSEDCMMGPASRYNVISTPLGFVIYAWSVNKEPLLFSHDGKFLGSIGNIGRGPGEFSAPFRIVYNEFLNIFMITHHKSIHIYSAKKEYLRTIHLNAESRNLFKLVPYSSEHFAVTYWEPTDNELIHVGVLIMDFDGEIINEFDFTDPDDQGCYRGNWTRIQLYLNQGNLIYSNSDSRKIYVLNSNEKWQEKYCLNYYFPCIPRYLLEGGRETSEELENYAQNNPRVSWGVLENNLLKIMYSTPRGYLFYVNLLTGIVHHCHYFRGFNTWGLQNDLDGTRPVVISNSHDGKSFELIDMTDIFRDKENITYLPEEVNPMMYEAYQKILSKLKRSDNPIIRVSHLKK